MLFAAQEQALRTNPIKAKIDKQPVSPKCGLCGCPKLAQQQYKRRHDNVTRRVNLELCKKHGLESSDGWYELTPVDVVENDEVELYSDPTIQTDMTAGHNRTDIFLVEKALTEIDNH